MCFNTIIEHYNSYFKRKINKTWKMDNLTQLIRSLNLKEKEEEEEAGSQPVVEVEESSDEERGGFRSPHPSLYVGPSSSDEEEPRERELVPDPAPRLSITSRMLAMIPKRKEEKK